VYRVCDPNVDTSRWHEVIADGTAGAARQFLSSTDLDPNQCAVDSFELHVAGDDAEEPFSRVKVRVVPAHFEVVS
jgi:hypothetical protein